MILLLGGELLESGAARRGGTAPGVERSTSGPDRDGEPGVSCWVGRRGREEGGHGQFLAGAGVCGSGVCWSGAGLLTEVEAIPTRHGGPASAACAPIASSRHARGGWR